MVRRVISYCDDDDDDKTRRQDTDTDRQYLTASDTHTHTLYTQTDRQTDRHTDNDQVGSASGNLPDYGHSVVTLMPH